MKEVRSHVTKTGVVEFEYTPKLSDMSHAGCSSTKNSPTETKKVRSFPLTFPNSDHFDVDSITHQKNETRLDVHHVNVVANDVYDDHGGLFSVFENDKVLDFERKIVWDPKSKKGTITTDSKHMQKILVKLGEGSHIDLAASVCDADLRCMFLPQSFFSPFSMRGTNFSGAHLDGSRFGSPFLANNVRKDYQMRHLRNVIFDAASLRDVTFESVNFYHTSFKGADLTGTKFVKCRTVGADFTDSNVTSEQIESVFHSLPEERREGSHFLESQGVKYRKYSFDDVCDWLNLKESQFEFFVLSGAFEIRDEEFNVVTSDFDPGSHHVPQWEMERWLTSTCQLRS